MGLIGIKKGKNSEQIYPNIGLFFCDKNVCYSIYLSLL